MMKRLLLTLCVLLLGATACGQEAETPQTTQTQPSTEESYSIAYAPNETVNRFLMALKERTGMNVQGVEQGSTANEYVMTLNGCQVSMSPSPTGMGVIIQSERGESGWDLLIGAFTHIVNAADKSCTQEQLEDAIAFMKAQTSGSTAYRVCNEVKILSYLPSVKVGGTETQHRLDLVLLGYVQVQQ